MRDGREQGFSGIRAWPWHVACADASSIWMGRTAGPNLGSQVSSSGSQVPSPGPRSQVTDPNSWVPMPRSRISHLAESLEIIPHALAHLPDEAFNLMEKRALRLRWGKLPNRGGRGGLAVTNQNQVRHQLVRNIEGAAGPAPH